MSIFSLSEELLSIFSEIEENGGEITPELEEQLNITKDNFNTKIEEYVNCTKTKENEIELIDKEINRLKSIKETKTKTIDCIKRILITSIKMFGETSRSGSKFYDYGTGKISIRQSKVVESDESLIKAIGDNLQHQLASIKENNQLDVIDEVNINDFIESFIKENKFKNPSFGYILTEDDLSNVKAEFTLDLNVSDIMNQNGYSAIKDIIKFVPAFKVKAKLDKVQLKDKLKEDGSCAPNIAKLGISESLIIK